MIDEFLRLPSIVQCFILLGAGGLVRSWLSNYRRAVGCRHTRKSCRSTQLPVAKVVER